MIAVRGVRVLDLSSIGIFDLIGPTRVPWLVLQFVAQPVETFVRFPFFYGSPCGIAVIYSVRRRLLRRRTLAWRVELSVGVRINFAELITQRRSAHRQYCLLLAETLKTLICVTQFALEREYSASILSTFTGGASAAPKCQRA